MKSARKDETVVERVAELAMPLRGADIWPLTVRRAADTISPSDNSWGA